MSLLTSDLEHESKYPAIKKANIETTYSIFNMPLFDHVRAVGQIPSWIRVKVANELASTAKEWCQIYERYNSGTYNNQWLVVDYKLFKPRQNLPPIGLLYLLEQVPGTIIYRDMTWYLRKYTYFPSYNVPYFKNTTTLSGFDKFVSFLNYYSLSTLKFRHSLS
ncbi:unnamed protein product [Anisakis simplex]|uniref:Phospholipase B-like n=1 Tax=Anisakis simplex TaxID=6269 RepID=A0A0M3J8A0_ANISI|nr:unnamed protein product [Anisakis simplex]